MKRLDLISAFEVSLASLSGIVGGIMVNEYAKQGSDKLWLFALTFLIVSTVIFSLSYLIGHVLRDRLAPVRKLISSDFIEGQWIQIVDDERFEGVPPTYSIVEIFKKDGEICVQGCSFNEKDGRESAQFYSLVTEFEKDRKTLRYYFKFSTQEQHDKKSLFGESELIFRRAGRKGPLRKYSGIVHSNLRDGVKVKAIRLEGKDKLKFDDHEFKEKIVKRIHEIFSKWE